MADPTADPPKTAFMVVVSASLLWDAAHLMDTAFCLSDDERLDERYSVMRDKLREAVDSAR